MSTLNSKAFHIIIEKYDKLNDKIVNAIDLATMLSEMPSVKEWSFILHDRDHTREHYHINLLLDTAHQPDTIMYSIARDLTINVKCIGVRSINLDTLFNRQRYLIHMDDTDKYQYKLDEVFSNNYENFKNCCIGINPYVCDIEYIYSLCIENDCLSKVYAKLGITKANTYRNIVKDIWQEVVNK